MYIKSFTLIHFRNYKKAHLDPHRDMNIILGDNAQGKSNLLEGIFLFTTGKSFRAFREIELINWDEAFSRLSMEIFHKNMERVKLEITLQRAKNNRNIIKTIKINNNIARSASDLVGTLNAVLFSPDDLEIIKGSPSARRRFIDLQSTQVSPSYCINLRDYYKVLEQRNSLLRSGENLRKNFNLIDIWDEQLAAYGAKLISRRLKNIKKLNELTDPILKDISSGKEKLKISYHSTVNIKGEKIDKIFPDTEREEFEKILEESIKNQLKSVRNQEIKKGATSIGPHRDDIHILINERPVKNFGSQGQQRSVALSLKLAERELINNITGEEPILLLDDITSELDKDRCSKLLSYIEDRGQIFLTQNHISHILKPVSEKSSIINIKEGTLQVGVFN